MNRATETINPEVEFKGDKMMIELHKIRQDICKEICEMNDKELKEYFKKHVAEVKSK